MNQPNFEYLDHLPKLPEEVVAAIYESLETNMNLFTLVYKNYKAYEFRKVSDAVTNFVQPLFGPEYKIGIQVVRNGIHVHVDTIRDEAINYILEPGGSNVSTSFYTPAPHELIESHVAEPHRWHKLNVLLHHNVEGIEEDKMRIALTVFKLTGSNAYTHLLK